MRLGSSGQMELAGGALVPTPKAFNSKAQGRRASRRTLGYRANETISKPQRGFTLGNDRRRFPMWHPVGVHVKIDGPLTQGAPQRRPWASLCNAFGVKESADQMLVFCGTNGRASS